MGRVSLLSYLGPSCHLAHQGALTQGCSVHVQKNVLIGEALRAHSTRLQTSRFEIQIPIKSVMANSADTVMATVSTTVTAMGASANDDGPEAKRQRLEATVNQLGVRMMQLTKGLKSLTVAFC